MPVLPRCILIALVMPLWNYTSLKLCISENCACSCFVPLRNCTTLKLFSSCLQKATSFVPLRNYTTLKHVLARFRFLSRFVPLRNYTTLKHWVSDWTVNRGFVPLRNYTTLKPGSAASDQKIKFCTSTKLHYSQTGRSDHTDAASVLYLYEITLL